VRLFPRAWRLSIGSRDLSALDLSFSVERKTRGAPGIATIIVKNPAPATISAAVAGAEVRLSAGHGSTLALLFSGTIRDARGGREGESRTLTITGRDGGGAYLDRAILSRAYAPGTSIDSVARDAVAALGVGEGNLRDALPLRLRNGATTFAAGYAAHGPARRVLADILAGAGYRWSVQHGAIQILRRGRPLEGRGEVLSPETGLLEVPTWDERRSSLTVKALIRPGLEPGARVRVESSDVRGDFEIRGVTWTGDTAGADWFAVATLRPL
jgi:hypothetical protein